jgi:hypothetical protein
MDILRRRRLLADGYSPAELRRDVRTGALVALRRGAYVDPATMPHPPEVRHALAVRAAWPALVSGAVISHASAAALFGLPLWGVPLDRVHVTRVRTHGAGSTRGCTSIRPASPRTRSSCWTASPSRRRRGPSSTSPAACRSRRPSASPTRHSTSASSCPRSWLTRWNARPVGPARPLPAGSSRSPTRSESPGESRSRVRMRRWGLPAPVLQMPIPTRLGVSYGDFGWPQYRAVGEFDGLVKYGRLLRPGQDAGQAVFEEKRREDAIRDEDWRVTRWTWPDLEPFEGVARRIERSFRR